MPILSSLNAGFNCIGTLKSPTQLPEDPIKKLEIVNHCALKAHSIV
jgi:hypothetical protein